MICPFCGAEHDNEGDRYGCPNCNGEGMKDKLLEIEMLYDQLAIKEAELDAINKRITGVQAELQGEVNTLLGMCSICGVRMEGQAHYHLIQGGKA